MVETTGAFDPQLVPRRGTFWLLQESENINFCFFGLSVSPKIPPLSFFPYFALGHRSHRLTLRSLLGFQNEAGTRSDIGCFGGIKSAIRYLEWDRQTIKSHRTPLGGFGGARVGMSALCPLTALLPPAPSHLGAVWSSLRPGPCTCCAAFLKIDPWPRLRRQPTSRPVARRLSAFKVNSIVPELVAES